MGDGVIIGVGVLSMGVASVGEISATACCPGVTFFPCAGDWTGPWDKQAVNDNRSNTGTIVDLRI